MTKQCTYYFKKCESNDEPGELREEFISDQDLANYTNVLQNAIRDGMDVSECSLRYRLSMATDLVNSRNALSKANAENATMKEEIREWKENPAEPKCVYLATLFENPAWGLRDSRNYDHFKGVEVATTKGLAEIKAKARIKEYRRGSYQIEKVELDKL